VNVCDKCNRARRRVIPEQMPGFRLELYRRYKAAAARPHSMPPKLATQNSAPILPQSNLIRNVPPCNSVYGISQKGIPQRRS
jgi:hypothetical protein